MAGIDKTYISDYQQFTQVRDWCKDKKVELKNGLVYNAIDFLMYPDMTEDEFNSWKDELIQRHIKTYNESREEAEKYFEIPLWNTPTYFDIWLIRNCPIDFIQERLKYQYGAEYNQIKNYRSEHDTYQRNGLGKNFHYKVIEKPNWKPRYNFIYTDRHGNKKVYKESRKSWWFVELRELSGNDIMWEANQDYDYWTNWIEALPFTSNMMDIRKKKNLNIHSIIRMIKHWDLPANTQVKVVNRYFNYGWVINIKK